MSTNAKKGIIRLPLIAILLLLWLMTIAIPQSIITFAAESNESCINEVNSVYENIEHDCGHDHSQVEYDLLDGYTGLGYNVEEIYLQQLGLILLMNATVSNANTCNSITSSHGAGRQNGFATNFLSTGCSNWRGYSYTYCDTNIPFFINTIGMSTALIEDIRAQVEMWNQTVMHDGTGQIVNIYEVNHTNNINGRPVVVVSRSTTLGNGVAGLFTGSPTAPTIQVAASMNVDTPLHEFGHLLGLNDIDPASESTSGTHPVLMGYSRGTTTSTLSSAIKYQDIQGIARVNNRHTEHNFDRYVVNGSRFIHFCFYCDTVDDRDSALFGATLMATAASCAHSYQPMVSQGSRHWYKCIKCYRVNETSTSPWNTTNVENNEIQIDSVSFAIEGRLFIPSTIDGRTVTRIKDNAFSGKSLITTVKLPNILHIIGNNTFSGCTGLSQISIPASITSIGNNAFDGCTNLEEVIFEDNSNLWLINEKAFRNCTSLTNIIIPSNVSLIGDLAFSNCSNLESITISSNTTASSTTTPFYGCTNLYNMILNNNQLSHQLIDNTGRLKWESHELIYNDNHNEIEHDLICEVCDYETTKNHYKHLVNNIEECIDCPWVGDTHTNHDYTYSYFPLPHIGQFPINKHAAYCFCGDHVVRNCVGEYYGDPLYATYCIKCGRNMTGGIGQMDYIINPDDFEIEDNIITYLSNQGTNYVDFVLDKKNKFL